MVAPRREHDAFRRQVDDAVLVLFALVSESIGWATTALLEQDVARAQQVIDADQGIDERCDDLTASLKERLSSGVTEPDELEYLVALLQIVPELERSADLAEHVAQRTIGHVGGLISTHSRGIIQSTTSSTSSQRASSMQASPKASSRRSRSTSR
jgi:phosphate transport system protein